jgi:hypothetical protein
MAVEDLAVGDGSGVWGITSHVIDLDSPVLYTGFLSIASHLEYSTASQ